MKIEHRDRAADLQMVLDAIPTPILLVDREHRLVTSNPSFVEITGVPLETMIGTSPRDVMRADEAERIIAAHNDVFESGEDDVTELTVTHPLTGARRLLNRRRRICIGGEPHLLIVLTDVTEMREAEARNRYLAFHDLVTGLPNRALLGERIEQALLRGGRKPGSCALLYLDLDNFKEVNDAHGHPMGDLLLRAFADRIAGVVRGSDTLARLGGDEFAVLLTDTGGECDAEEICRRVLAVAAEPFDLDGVQVRIGASIGLALLSDDAIGADEFRRRADVALYDAKAAGRSCFRAYSSALDEQLRHRRQIERDLRAALAVEGELEVHYQPIVGLPGERVTAMEALVRWRHPTQGLLAPDAFVPLAEQSGQIVALGEWVLCAAAAALAPFPEVAVAVNISPAQLLNDEAVERMLAIVDAAGLPRERLQLEVTEVAIVDEQAARRIRKLRKAGVKIVLDDFGTGYSSLAHLQRLSVDKVKIDQSFVRNLGTGEDSRVIISAVLGIGASLGIAVTAEGVETDFQRQCLKLLGCTEYQGFHFARPMPEAEAMAWLAAHTPAKAA